MSQPALEIKAASTYNPVLALGTDSCPSLLGGETETAPEQLEQVKTSMLCRSEKKRTKSTSATSVWSVRKASGTKSASTLTGKRTLAGNGWTAPITWII
ncbi:hypothetical protein JRQ81_012390 [Phrynocephalus forsythii]|uniref:Uncharacterized protein n=1 Tax=Phrynocephalus forsythii TaxID=171643 RepID=A0A9Q1AQF6_9SAUR|nr:hypothetical protein JRQ81_012390 [Phrynocephalus forsythii]